MVHNKTFGETVKELGAFKALSNSDKASSKDSCSTGTCEPKKEDPYHVVGKEWQGPLGGAPYANVRLNADRVWKMPGMRSTMKDQIGGMCKKYWLVYNNFFKLAVCSVGAFLSFFVMGGLFVYAGIALVIGMGCYYQAYKQHLETAYSLESNWGALLPIGAERSYMVDSKWSGKRRSKK